MVDVLDSVLCFSNVRLRVRDFNRMVGFLRIATGTELKLRIFRALNFVCSFLNNGNDNQS